MSRIVCLRDRRPTNGVLRRGARQHLARAVEVEAEAFLATLKGLKLADRLRAAWLRSGANIVTGIVLVEVASAKVRDHGAAGDGWRIRFSSAILPL
ncbi:hypothetical protein [Bradyrhizobium sp. CCBAU 51627]|uniref:hypothetical protein n=1 Tax=Bradyrhizobium sp. CCBAU 51627 TaxID=1325088 RepID=UPI0023056D9D|nr:hypothetical protein [Bradyrhizobium sp. CCBAU 51627]